MSTVPEEAPRGSRFARSILQDLVLNSAVILLIAGCGCRRQSPPPARQNLQEAPRLVTRQAASGDAREPAENGPGGNEEDPGKKDCESRSREENSGVRTYNTGDWDVWPSYDWPLVIEIEVLEFPAGIIGPSPPIP